MRFGVIDFAILIGAIIFAVVLMGLVIVSPDEFAGVSSYVFFSFLSTLVVFYAVQLPSSRFNGKIDVFSPMCGLLFVLLLGTGLRAPYLALVRDHSAAARSILLGYSLKDVTWSMGVFFIGILSLVLGYTYKSIRVPIERLPIVQAGSISPKRLLLFALAFTFIALVGIAAYIQANGISFANGLAAASSKKALAFETESGAVVYGSGFQFVLGQVTKYPFVILASFLLVGLLPKRGLWIGLTILLGALSVAIPFLSNTRAAVVVMGFTVLIVLKYYGRLKPGIIIIWLALSLSLIILLTQLRSENQQADIKGTNIVETMLASGNGLDSYRSALIINLVPEREPYQLGKTYLAFIVSFVPREIWPTKPNVSLGPWIKSEVFDVPDVRNNGWPPGIIAEAYLNFSYIGVVIIPFLYGLFLRTVYETAKPLLGRSMFVTIAYASSLYPLCFSGLSNNISLGMAILFATIVPVILFYFLIWLRPRAQRAQASALQQA